MPHSSARHHIYFNVLLKQPIETTIFIGNQGLIFNIIGIHRRKNPYLALANPLRYLENGQY
ncbi:MAG: hypothetical protein DCF12_20100 [Snowella sp.]|nr:MAG: hypothetical protein DCF12_20100 [Snowella sp.]